MLRYCDCYTVEEKLEYLKQEFGPRSSYHSPTLIRIIDSALNYIEDLKKQIEDLKDKR